MLIGNLTRDPELRYLPNNTPVANIGLAINRKWKNRDGESQEETTYVDCESFGKQAEIINQYCRKGKPLYIDGRLKLDQWQDREGQKRSRMKVVVENFQFIDGPREQSGDQQGPPRQAAGDVPGFPTPRAITGPQKPINEEDIPF